MTFPTVTVKAAFDDGPLTVPTYDVDLSSRLLDVSWDLGRTRDLEDWLPSGFSLTFDNSDRQLDPEYTSGTYYGSLLPRVPVRVQVTHDATTYDLLHGFAGEDGWRQTYSPPAVAECSVRCTDLLGVMAGRKLPSLYDVEVLADSPKAYWKLTEPDGALVAIDSSGNGFDGVYRNDPRRIDSGGVVGEGGREFDGFNQAVDIPHSAVIVGTDPSAAHGFAVEAWVYTKSTPASWASIFAQLGDSIRDKLRLNMNSATQYVFEWAYTESTGVTGGLTIGTNKTGFNDGQWHHVVGSGFYPGVIEDYDEDVYVAGELLSRTAIAAQAHGSASGVVIGGPPNKSETTTRFWNGYIGHVSIYEANLSSTRIAAHYVAGSAPLDGDRTGERAAYILETLVGVNAALLDIDDGLSILGPAIIQGLDALGYITTCARTEQGILTVAHWDAGQIRFIGRDAILSGTRHTTSQATFTDKDGSLSAGEYRYEPNIVVEPASINSVINQVTVNFENGSVTVEDETSVAAYGPRSRSFDTVHDAPSEARSFAEYVLDRYKDPITRVSQITIDGAACPENIEAILSLRVGDRVTVERKPQNTGNTITNVCLIEGIKGRIADGVETIEATYYLSPADTKVYGLWGSGNWDEALWAY